MNLKVKDIKRLINNISTNSIELESFIKESVLVPFDSSPQAVEAARASVVDAIRKLDSLQNEKYMLSIKIAEVLSGTFLKLGENEKSFTEIEQDLYRIKNKADMLKDVLDRALKKDVKDSEKPEFVSVLETDKLLEDVLQLNTIVSSLQKQLSDLYDSTEVELDIQLPNVEQPPPPPEEPAQQEDEDEKNNEED